MTEAIVSAGCRPSTRAGALDAEGDVVVERGRINAWAATPRPISRGSERVRLVERSGGVALPG